MNLTNEQTVGVISIFLILGVGFLAGYFLKPCECPELQDCSDCEAGLANVTDRLAVCVNISNALVQPVVLSNGTDFACCSKAGQCITVPEMLEMNESR